MKDSLKYILSLLTDKPNEININEVEENGIINYQVSLAKEDMGKIIGKSGKIIRAIRNVMKIPAIKQGKRINIELQESA